MSRGKLYTEILSTLGNSGLSRTDKIEVLENISRVLRKENSYLINANQMGRSKIEERPDLIQMKVEGN